MLEKIIAKCKEEIEWAEADIKELEQLGFLWSDSDDCFISFKYGSA